MSSLLSDDDKLRFARMLADEFRPSAPKSRGPRRAPAAARPPPPAPRPPPVLQRPAPARAFPARPAAALSIARPSNPIHRDQASANFLNNAQPAARDPLSATLTNKQSLPSVQKQPIAQVPPVTQIQHVAHTQPDVQGPGIHGDINIKRDRTQTPNAPINGDDILQQLIRAVPTLSGTFRTQNDNIEDGSDSDSDMDMMDMETEPISLLERVFASKRKVFGLDNSIHNSRKPKEGVQDLRTTMLGRVDETVAAVRTHMAKGREHAVRALVVHLMLIEHGGGCPYVEALREAYPVYFGYRLYAGDAGEDSGFDVRLSNLRRPETSKIPTHEVYSAMQPTPAAAPRFHRPTTHATPAIVAQDSISSVVGLQGTGLRGTGRGLTASRWA
ncbi:hypothetical protein F5X68DRAFT_231710 [Plectosphaerella plurivora]|uniref:Uncharacterized protein n=1 Tax=Plectosphaerella plurivora TaxID=936078 RepID=A0A9P9AAC9_9PEZI|nr:hypothetical protein F5X68DRAFT_231710 [Plectosphaerella plurivora]